MWKIVSDHYLKLNSKTLLSERSFSTRDISIPNELINDICTSWSHDAFYSPLDDLKNQIIRNNSFIKVIKKIVFYRNMYENGIAYVKDLYHVQNNLLSIDRIFSIHNVLLSVLKVMSIQFPILGNGTFIP